MTDRTRSEYKKYVDSKMEPSEEFLSRLTQTLQKEQERLGSQEPAESIVELSVRRRRISYAVAAAAALAVAVGVTAFSYLRLPGDSQAGENPPVTEGTLPDYVGETGHNASAGSLIGNPDWCDDSLTKESLTKALSQKMQNSLERLSQSEDNKFVDALPEGAQTIEQVLRWLVGAEICEADVSAEEISDRAVYYMAVFTDGTVAKFRIADEKYLVISGDDTIYEIK